MLHENDSANSSLNPPLCPSASNSIQTTPTPRKSHASSSIPAASAPWPSVMNSAISYSMGIEENESIDCERCEANQIIIRDLRLENASLKRELEGIISIFLKLKCNWKTFN